MAEPPRTGKSIFARQAGKGHFLDGLKPSGQPQLTSAKQGPVAERLHQGVYVSRVQVGSAHRNPNIPVCGMSPHTAVLLTQPKPSAYPRSGSESSLMYRCPSERLGAHNGYSPRVSVCATLRTLPSSELQGAQQETKLVAVQQPAPPMAEWPLHRSIPKHNSPFSPYATANFLGTRTPGRRIIVVPDAQEPLFPRRRPSAEPRRSISADPPSFPRSGSSQASVEVGPVPPPYAAPRLEPRGQLLFSAARRGGHNPRAIATPVRVGGATVVSVSKPQRVGVKEHLPPAVANMVAGIKDPTSLTGDAAAPPLLQASTTEYRPSLSNREGFPQAQVISLHVAERASFVDLGAPRMSFLATPGMCGLSSGVGAATTAAALPMAVERAEPVLPAGIPSY